MTNGLVPRPAALPRMQEMGGREEVLEREAIPRLALVNPKPDATVGEPNIRLTFRISRKFPPGSMPSEAPVFFHQQDITSAESEAVFSRLMTFVIQTIRKSPGSFYGMAAVLDVAHWVLEGWQSEKFPHKAFLDVPDPGEPPGHMLALFRQDMVAAFQRKIAHPPDPCKACPNRHAPGIKPSL